MGRKEATPTVAVVGGGVSGLATGWFLRRDLERLGMPARVMVLEKDHRPGGKFEAFREDGYIVEKGPNGFLDSKPWTLDLVEELGMRDRLLPSDQAAARRFIYTHGRLHELKGPFSLMFSSLMTPAGRLGMVRELFAPPTPRGRDTTLEEFALRRLGREPLERLLDPMVSGIFAGDPSRMSLKASFPRIAELEERYGGLLRAWISIIRERRRAKRRGEQVEVSSGPSGPGGVLTSFKDGVEELTRRLAQSLGEGFTPGAEVRRISRTDGRWLLTMEDGETVADAVVLAAPAHAASRILAEAAPLSGDLISRIPYSPMAVVGFGYELSRLPDPPHGFGFLVPHVEGRRILGALWTSSIFPGYRSPPDRFLIRVMAGGARDHDTPFLGDDELVPLVRRELAFTMGLDMEPSFVRIARWRRAIPLYLSGHLERLEKAERALPEGIVLAGNAYRGVGINDCVREAEAAARRVVDWLRVQSAERRA